MTLIIRTATESDADAIRQVGEQAFATVRRVYRPSRAAKANVAAIAPTLECLVAEEHARIIGTVRFGVSNDVLRVVGLAVLPEFRCRGVARSLIGSLVAIAQNRRCRALALYTVTQTGNVKIFERLGFRIVSERPDEYSVSPSGPLTVTYMEREVV